MFMKKGVRGTGGSSLARKILLLLASHQKVQHILVLEITHPTYTRIPLFVVLCCYRMCT